MIRIIKGIYGYKDAKGNVVPKTEKDKPFHLQEDQEERLVNRGIAEYVETHAPQEDAGENKEVAPVQQEETQEQQDELQDMSYNDLKHLAKELGIPAVGSKEELIEKIRMAEQDADDGEEPPELMAADPEA